MNDVVEFTLVCIFVLEFFNPAEQVRVEDFPDLIDNIRKTDLQLGGAIDVDGAISIGLIERLLLNGIKGIELTKILGLWSEGDNKIIRDRAKNMMRVYYYHRWGVVFEWKVLAFLAEHYLGDY